MPTRTPLCLLQGAKEYFPALIQAIDAAQTTIYMESYLIHHDPPTQQVLEALIRARHRGVTVYMLLDGFGAQSEMEWVHAQCDPHGIDVELYRPGVRWLAPRTWRRLHRKLVLIDEQIGFIGGINLIGDHYDPAHGWLAQPRLDFAVMTTSVRVVDRLSRTMRRLWWRVTLRNAVRGSLKRLLDAKDRSSELIRMRDAWRRTRRHLRWRGPRVRRHASRRSRLLLRDNLRYRRSIERWYLWHIHTAQREIVIANAYFVPTFRFRQALMAAARRGVRVRLLIQGNSDQWWTAWATQALIGELVASGVEVYEYTTSFLHAKVAVMDQSVTVGSSNIDPFSLTLSLEANLIADDMALSERLTTTLNHAITTASRRLHPTPVQRGPLAALSRGLALTLALMALRCFVAFSGTGFRVR